MPQRDPPVTRFAATTNGSSIAYQVIGDGAVSIVSVPPLAQNIELAWDWPAIRRMFEGFASFCRFVPFDKRGTGMSNRSLDIPRLDERVDELSAVFDGAGLDGAYLMGTSEGGPMALVFAATYPERVQGLVLESTAAWVPGVDDASGGWDAESRARLVSGWGTAESIVVDVFAPSLADDHDFRQWHQRYERNAASRDAIDGLLELSTEMDARGVLHRIECPVLMLHRTGDHVVPIEAARETCRLLRSHGVDVELIETPGEDHLLYAADMTGAFDAIERFTTGRVSDRKPGWVPEGVQILTMGHFEVRIDDRTVPTAAWGSRRARTLLKRLVAERGGAVTREELADVLWPGDRDVDRLGARLSVQLSAVRRVLHGGVVADRTSVRLDLDHVEVDIEAWFALTDDAAIVTEYGGDFLPDDRYDDWSTTLREEIRSRFGAAIRRLAEISAPSDAVELWRRALAAEPYDERSHQSLVRALRADGRLGEARSAYQSYVAAMDDLDVPSTAWDQLEP